MRTLVVKISQIKLINNKDYFIKIKDVNSTTIPSKKDDYLRYISSVNRVPKIDERVILFLHEDINYSFCLSIGTLDEIVELKNKELNIENEKTTINSEQVKINGNIILNNSAVKLLNKNATMQVIIPSGSSAGTYQVQIINEGSDVKG